MSFSVDDLASSLSSSHIGQEALDLVLLQAQLTQALHPQSVTRSSSWTVPHQNDSYLQPCNTPTSSTGQGWGYLLENQRQPKDASFPQEYGISVADEVLDEDEHMVEDLLVPLRETSDTPSNAMPFSGLHEVMDPSAPFHTSIDPFHLPQRQTSDACSTVQPVFSRVGRLPQHSSFSQVVESHCPLATASPTFHR